MRKLVNYKCDRFGEGDKKLFKLLYSRRWWGILSMSVQRAVASNLHGGDWAGMLGIMEPSAEELLRAAIVPPQVPRLR